MKTLENQKLSDIFRGIKRLHGPKLIQVSVTLNGGEINSLIKLTMVLFPREVIEFHIKSAAIPVSINNFKTS